MPAPAVTGAGSSFGGAMGGGGGGMSLLERTAMEDDERASRPDATGLVTNSILFC